MSDIPLPEQLAAIESQALGVRDLIERARAGKISRPKEWMDTKERRLAALRAAYLTIRRAGEEVSLNQTGALFDSHIQGG